MSNINVSADDLGTALADILAQYSGDVHEKVKEAIDKTADELVTSLEADSPDSGQARRKKYRKGWAKKVMYENEREKRVTVHNKTAYQLTHLLENGHAKRGGNGRTAAIVHIKPNEEKANEKLLERIKEAAKG